MPAQLFWNAANLWPLAVAVGLGVVALVVWLYPVQTRGLSRPFQVILPLLRVLAIVALVLSLLKPTLLRPATQQENGAIVVLVDRSASMGVSDSELTPADRVAIADGLGIIAEKRRKHIAPEASAALALLQRGLDRLSRAGGDLEYARLSGRQVTQRQAELDEAFTQARQQAAAL